MIQELIKLFHEYRKETAEERKVKDKDGELIGYRKPSFFDFMEWLEKNMFCKENWETKPYSSEHLWNADHHGIPLGKCTKCGKDNYEWNKKLDEIISNNS